MTVNLKETCERCGFVPIDMCQLDVVYIDGNGSALSPELGVEIRRRDPGRRLSRGRSLSEGS